MEVNCILMSILPNIFNKCEQLMSIKQYLLHPNGKQCMSYKCQFVEWNVIVIIKRVYFKRESAERASPRSWTIAQFCVQIEKSKMYATSPQKMDTLQVPRTRHPIKIQPMDASFTVMSDDEEEYGLGYQNTLVRIEIVCNILTLCPR